MEEEWVVDRGRLRRIMHEHPDWSQRRLARATQRSVGWVKKWRQRLRAARDDERALHSRLRAGHTPCRRVSEVVVKRILDLRDRASEQLGRTAGPVAILYYLHWEADLLEKKIYLPRSTSTVWRILDEHQRIRRQPKVEHCPVERPEPMTVWQMDFKDVSTARSETSSKRKHQVEVLNVVDAGTSIAVESVPHDDFNAETTIETLAGIFLVEGLPRMLTFDRDPRFVGSWTGSDFPSALVRFLGCIGVKPDILEPHDPDSNCFVERFNGSYSSECMLRYRPATLENTRQVSLHYKWFYNTERPNQSSACGNRPPYVTFPELLSRPRLPAVVDPDAWLSLVHGERFKRRVNPNGSIQIGRQRYYVQQQLRGRQIIVQPDTQRRQLTFTCEGNNIKQAPIKGLHDTVLEFHSYLKLILAEARSEWRQLLHSRTTLHRTGYYADVF